MARGRSSKSVSGSVGSVVECRRCRYSPLVGVGDVDEDGEVVDEADKMVAVWFGWDEK